MHDIRPGRIARVFFLGLVMMLSACATPPNDGLTDDQREAMQKLCSKHRGVWVLPENYVQVYRNSDGSIDQQISVRCNDGIRIKKFERIGIQV